MISEMVPPLKLSPDIKNPGALLRTGVVMCVARFYASCLNFSVPLSSVNFQPAQSPVPIAVS